MKNISSRPCMFYRLQLYTVSYCLFSYHDENTTTTTTNNNNNNNNNNNDNNNTSELKIA